MDKCHKRGDNEQITKEKILLWSIVTHLVLRRIGVGAVMRLRESRVGPGFNGNGFGCFSLNVLAHFPITVSSESFKVSSTIAFTEINIALQPLKCYGRAYFPGSR